MAAATVPECLPLAKKRPDREESQGDYDRIELQAETDWVKKLDAAAKAMGLSRSAYIRLACNKLMAADRRDRGED
jgi:hypothetical protein